MERKTKIILGIAGSGCALAGLIFVGLIAIGLAVEPKSPSAPAPSGLPHPAPRLPSPAGGDGVQRPPTSASAPRRPAPTGPQSQTTVPSESAESTQWHCLDLTFNELVWPGGLARYSEVDRYRFAPRERNPAGDVLQLAHVDITERVAGDATRLELLVLLRDKKVCFVTLSWLNYQTTSIEPAFAALVKTVEGLSRNGCEISASALESFRDNLARTPNDASLCGATVSTATKGDVIHFAIVPPTAPSKAPRSADPPLPPTDS
jgi:hypothetical protein